MAGETVIGYMTYKLGLDSTNLKRGVQTAKQDIKELERSADTSDIKMKKLAGDVSVLGGSLATMGGLAMGAGLALGDSGLGGALTTAGMGMAVMGGTLATIVPALRGAAVVIQGQLIPALVAANAFLGPTGWIVIGLGIAVTALYALKRATDDASTGFYNYNRVLEDNKSVAQELDTLYGNIISKKNELAGIPEEKADLELSLTGARIADRQAQEALNRVASNPESTALEIQQAGYNKLVTEDRINKIIAKIEGLPAKEAELNAELRTEQNKYGMGSLAAQAYNVPESSKWGAAESAKGLWNWAIPAYGGSSGVPSGTVTQGQGFTVGANLPHIKQENAITVIVSRPEDVKPVVDAYTMDRYNQAGLG
jgi:hypothetical protein